MKKIIKYMDKPLLIITTLLFIMGLVMIFSASNVTAYMSHAVSPYNYFLKQGVILIIGVVFSFVMIRFNTNTYGWASRLLTLIGIILLVLVLFVGDEKNQAVSWFDLGYFSFQPGEFIKIITIVFLADYYDKNKGQLTSWWKSLYPIIISIVIAALIFLEPDLGTTIIYSAIVVAIFLAVPIAKEIKFKTIFITLGLLFFGIIVVMGAGKGILLERQLKRFDYFNPCDRILDDGNQVCNCYIAINNGGLTGKGLGNSTQKYLYLPEPYTDFIYAIIVEELGVITGVLLILCYMFIMFRILLIGRKSPNNRGAVLCYGVAIYLFLHIAVNLLGIMGVIPMTGVPLPFMSYGGSFTLCLIAGLTLVQRVSVENGMLAEKSVKNA